MDRNAWNWKKKSTEKTILTDSRANISTNSIEEEKRLNDKAQHEHDLKILNEKLSVAISECNAREDFAKKQGSLAQEAIAGWEKAETEVKMLKLELEKSLQQRVASEEKNSLLDGALKECMQQLRFVREDQEKRICDAVKKASKEFERMKLDFDEKLAEATKRLAKVESENIKLSKALMSKEKVIAELCSLKARAEANYAAVIKENTSLRYEVHVLQKELEIRNEEREFNRRTTTASHKQHLESVKKIAKLESECHRLRILVRKRLPGPAALAQMKNEVKLLGNDHQFETTIKRSSSSLIGSMEFALDAGPNNVNSQREQSLIVEKGNKTVVKHPEGSSISMASMSDLGSDDKVSCTGSWASTLVSEMEQCKDIKEASKASSNISVGFSDMSLMDDFVQMERLAVVSTENSIIDSNRNAVPLEAPIPDVLPLHLSNMPPSSYDYDHSENGLGCAITEMLQMILGKCHELRRNPNEMLEEIKAGLPLLNHQNSQSLDSEESSKPYEKEVSCGPKEILEGSPVKTSLSGSSLMGTCDNSMHEKKGNQKPHSSLSISMHKIIELIEGISIQLPQDYKHPETSTGYVGRVFQWKASELSTTLEQFLQACNDFMNEKSDVEYFAEQLTFTLAWVLDHCFSLQDVSSMKYAIQNSFVWDEKSESELDIGTVNRLFESNNMHTAEKESLSSVKFYQNSQFQEEPSQVNGDTVDTSFKDIQYRESADNESSKRDLDGEFQRRESSKLNEGMQTDVNNTTEQLKEETEDQSEADKLVHDDLITELSYAENDLNESPETRKLQDTKTEKRIDACENSGATRNNLQSEQESVDNKEAEDDLERIRKQLRTDMEITEASEKLAECQETILNLGKQLKALAPPTQNALSSNKVISNMTLLDKMLVEDNADIEVFSPAKAKEGGSAYNGVDKSSERLTETIRADNSGKSSNVRSSSGVRGKKRSNGGLLMKLFCSERKSSCKQIDVLKS